MLNDDEKPRWQRPDLTLVGRLGDLVQGGGKTGENVDAEGTRKRGWG